MKKAIYLKKLYILTAILINNHIFELLKYMKYHKTFSIIYEIISKIY